MAQGTENRFGLCNECGLPKTDCCWCERCDNTKLVQNFSDWTTGNKETDEFIQNTQRNAKSYISYYEYIPYDDFEKIEYLTRGLSFVYTAWWKAGERIDNPMDEYNPSYKRERSGKIPVVLKRPKKSKMCQLENELRMNHKFASYGIRYLECYGVTMDLNRNIYIVMEYAKDGDLRRHLLDNPNLKWQDKLQILCHLAHDLETLHNADLVHANLHSKSVIIRGTWAYISGLASCRPANQPASNESRGLLPYKAPEVLRGGPHTKASNVYSFGIFMATVASNKDHYSYDGYDYHNKYNLRCSMICNGLRPNVPEKTPKCYRDLMERCWDLDPNRRPIIQKIKIIFEHWIRNPTYNIVNEFIDIGQISEPKRNTKLLTLPNILENTVLNNLIEYV